MSIVIEIDPDSGKITIGQKIKNGKQWGNTFKTFEPEEILRIAIEQQYLNDPILNAIDNQVINIKSWGIKEMLIPTDINLAPTYVYFPEAQALLDKFAEIRKAHIECYYSEKVIQDIIERKFFLCR